MEEDTPQFCPGQPFTVCGVLHLYRLFALGRCSRNPKEAFGLTTRPADGQKLAVVEDSL